MHNRLPFLYADDLDLTHFMNQHAISAGDK